jgi:gentisate 1,2-dioxygenase
MKTVPELETWMAERGLEGFWKPERPSKVLPHLWKWSDIVAATEAALELIPKRPGKEPRVVKLRSPTSPSSTTRIIDIHVQCLVKGEPLQAHRHTPEAARFIVAGSLRAFTVVDGERLSMETGDFLTTPRWSWHDHYSEADEPVIWIDILDINLPRFLQAGAWEHYERPAQSISRPVGFSEALTGRLRPSRLIRGREKMRPAPVIHHRWADALQTLLRLKEIDDCDPFDGYQAVFCHPLTGDATLSTFACGLQLLTGKTRSHRHTSTTICHVVRGTGRTVVDGHELSWGKGDIFTIPSLLAHRHEKTSDEDAILFFVDDWPVSRALDLYWEEALSEEG